MTIKPDEGLSDERLAELIGECQSAADNLGATCADADANGKFVEREFAGVRSVKFADTATLLRELQRRRSADQRDTVAQLQERLDEARNALRAIRIEVRGVGKSASKQFHRLGLSSASNIAERSLAKIGDVSA